MKTIETKYLGPTNFKGSRIRATDGDNTIFLSRDCCDSIDEAHSRTALALKAKLGWTGKMIGGHTKSGMVFVFVKGALEI